MTDWADRIVSDAGLHHREPCVRGTPVPVSVIVASLADLSVDELPTEYRQLTRDDVRAALFYASRAAHTTLVP